MTQEYTPTTDEVCECWTTRYDIGNPYETDANVEERHHEESVKFARWLHKVRAEAWEEGHHHGEYDRYLDNIDITPNPYIRDES